MKLKLLDYICCPQCKDRFLLNKKEVDNEEVISGELLCKKCNRSYSIINGIPRIISRDLLEKEVKTGSSFGYKWKIFPEFEKIKFSEFESYIGNHLDKEFFKDKIILDAGCGMGNFSSVAASFGAKDVIGVDLSTSVEAANRYTNEYKNLHFIQADINELPFKNDFDFIFSIGVLHHLPDCNSGFLGLVNKHLKTDGSIFVWFYGKEGNWIFRTFFDPIRENITSRLPEKLNAFLSGIITIPVFLAMKLIYVPLNKIMKGSFLPMNEYVMYFTKFGYRRIWENIMDKMIPPYHHYYSEQDMHELLENKAGLKDVEISFRNGNSWRGLGKKN